MTISPLQLARVPNLLASTVAASQMESTQQQLLTVEQQISTGQQFTQPSDNPGATSVTMQLQRTLTQSQTYLSNITTAQSQLGQVDNSLSNLTTLVQQAQSIASADVNSDVTDAQRSADAQIVDSISSQALNIANVQYNGLYLFGGDKNTSPPFVATNGGIQFVGSTNVLQNAVDNGTTLPFMVSGAQVFGGAASRVQGTADLTPSLTAMTRLSDLRGANGTGVQLGSIQISNGTTSKIVDLSQANTMSDVVNAINAAGVGGITATLTGTGLTLSGAAADNITVSDVAGDTTADDLGIAKTTGAGNGIPLVGVSTQPNVTVLTPLSSLKSGAGIDLHGLTINNGAKTANISFAGATTVGDVLNDINGAGLGVQASIDPSGTGIDIANPTQGLQMTVSENGGTSAADLGVRSFSPQTPLSELNNGAGVTFAASGADFKVTASDGATFGVTLAGSATVQDVINKINAAAGGSVVAGFSPTSNAITLTDKTGGAGTLTVSSQNSSTAATALGLTQNAAVGGTITGTDVNPVAAQGVFADLTNLSNALKAGNASQITAAAQNLQNDYQQILNVRGAAGAQVDQMQSRQSQLTTENTATQSLMSQLSDTDFTAAITKFQTLQTSLQATLEVSAKTLNESLLDFLG